MVTDVINLTIENYKTDQLTHLQATMAKAKLGSAEILKFTLILYTTAGISRNIP